VTKPKLDQILATPVANPFLMQRRVELGYVQATAVRGMTTNASGAAQPSAPPAMRGFPTMVDWRNRWGWNWVTSVQSQGCSDCWAFASAALIESMVRIEHVEARRGRDA
jgi:C1A family cysteine protease